MKPLLRTFLAINAVIVLLFGLLFIVTPWWHYFEPLAAFASAPALVGQLFGVVLFGLGCLFVNAVVNGALSAPVARITGHPIWVCGVVLLIWQIALHEPSVDADAAWIVLGVGVALVVLGLGQARLGGAVRARERREWVGARSAERAEAKARATAPGSEPGSWDSPAAPSDRSATGFSRSSADPYIGTPPAAVSRDPTDTPYVVRTARDDVALQSEPSLSDKTVDGTKARDVPPSF